jgi:hypothetical protein
MIEQNEICGIQGDVSCSSVEWFLLLDAESRETESLSGSKTASISN